VTLTATALAGYAFTGWSNDCIGASAVCVVRMDAAKTVMATFGIATAGAPMILYTDALSGPTSGGEGNAGAYLSIYGKNFGTAGGLGTTTRVFIGSCEVANYRHLSAAKVGTKLGIQHLAVQVGSLCGATQGIALPVKVVVSGVSSNTDNTFMPNPGRMLYVSLTGNDSTAVAGDISKPWRYLQTSAAGGAYGVLKAGDHIVIRGGNWSDIGLDGAWLRFRYPQQQGSAPTGASGTGWMHITAYPGPINGNAPEDVHYSTLAGVKGGIHGANSAYYGTTGDWVSISNLRMDVNANATSDAGPINLQYGAGPWRVVNNELGPWPSAINSKAAGVSGHGKDVQVLGNHIYGMGCTGALENHGIYIDSGGSNWKVAYNWIHDITGGNLIQLYDNVGLAGNNYPGFPAGWTGFTGIQIHHNWLENSGKYGLNLSLGMQSGAIWNNLIIGATYSGLRLDTISKNMDWTVAYNTFYDNDRVASGSGNAQVLNTWGNYNPTGTVRVYDNIFAAGPRTVRSGSYYQNAGDGDAYMDLKRNLWFDNGYGWAAFACSACKPDTLALYGSPRFTAAGATDFSLQMGSPAINTGTQAVSISVNNDFTSLTLRPSGPANEVGAFEFSQ
jgi:Divergent InlB B-repeat domain